MSSTLPSDIAYRMLRLEQQLESYRRLHEEELEQMHRALVELKEQVLVLAAPTASPIAKETESNQTEGG